MKNDLILNTVMLVTGASIMVIELAGSRVLAPFVGTSIFVWTSLIGIVLASLSFGYWWGGSLADRKQDVKILFGLLFAAGLFIAVMALTKDYILYALVRMPVDIRMQSLLASLIMFSFPNILLGMVAPYVVKFQLHSLETSGRTVGNLYALSTLGSIAGTFIGGYVLIPFWGSTNMLFLVAMILIALSLSVLARRQRMMVFIALLALTAGVLATDTDKRFSPRKVTVVDEETLYNRVWIFNHQDKNGELIKVMRLNNEGNSAAYLLKQGLVADYLKFFRIIEHFHPGFDKTLMLGGGAYSYPQDYLKRYPEATIDVVEIDPRLTDLARQHFGLKEDPRLRIFHQDARIYLNTASRQYDVILVDVFNSLSIVPYQVTTREALARMRALLNDQGVVCVNLISALSGPKGLFARAEYATYAEVFDQVYLFQVDKSKPKDAVQNIILVALKSDKPVPLRSADAELKAYLDNRVIEPVARDVPVLTDAHAPVEHYIGKAMLGNSR